MTRNETLIDRQALDNNTVLEHVINAGGERYSVILINGVEMLSAPTIEEARLIAYWQQNKALLTPEEA